MMSARRGGKQGGLSKKFPKAGPSRSTAAPTSPPSGSDPEDSDAASVNGEFILAQRQDPRERRRIRQQYSELREQTQANRHDLIKPSSCGLQETLEQTQQAFKNVKETREAAMDSSMIALISQLTKQQAQALHTDFVTFEPAEFAEKLITLISGHELPQAERERTRLSKDGWIKLGEAAQPFFKRSPALHCMLGTFEKGPPKKKPQIQRTKPAKDQDSQKGPSKPTELTSFKQTNEEVTTQEVERMYQILSRFYQKQNRNPVCYFEFVVNPHSFSLTVENVFYASFLIRDGHARIFLDDDKLPVIEPVEKVSDENSLSRLPRHQVVMTINMQEWKDVVKTFNITEPLIEPRSTEPRAGTSAADERGGKKKKK